MIRGLYAIADADFGDPVALALQLLEGEVETLQVRCKRWEPSRVREALQEITPACAARGCLVLVNDHEDLAPLAGGLHLGQEGIPDRLTYSIGESCLPSPLVVFDMHQAEGCATLFASECEAPCHARWVPHRHQRYL